MRCPVCGRTESEGCRPAIHRAHARMEIEYLAPYMDNRRNRNGIVNPEKLEAAKKRLAFWSSFDD